MCKITKETAAKVSRYSPVINATMQMLGTFLLISVLQLIPLLITLLIIGVFLVDSRL